MSTDGFDPTIPDHFDDSHGPFDTGDVADLADLADPGHEDDFSLAEPPVPDPAEALGPLFAAGGPLALTPDPAADAELEQWLNGPAPEPVTARELAVLDRLLRTGLTPE